MPALLLTLLPLLARFAPDLIGLAMGGGAADVARRVEATAVALWTGPAAAQFDSVSGAATAEFLRSSGPWGLVAVCFAVITLLWRRNQKLSDDMSGLLTRRGDDADARAERFAVVATTATNAIATGAEAAREVKQKQDAVLDAVRLLPPAIEVVGQGRRPQRGPAGRGAEPAGQRGRPMSTWTERLLAFLGFVAQPHFRDPRVHDASNREAVAMAALHIVAARTEGAMQSIIADQRTDDRPQALRREIDRMRATMTEVARRADR